MPERGPARPSGAGLRVLGMLSGTSHDGIDVAVVRFAPAGDEGAPAGGELVGVVEHVATTPFDEALRSRLVAALPPAGAGVAEIAALDADLGRAFAAAADAAASAPAVRGPVDLVCSHGQTVFHWVEDGAVLGTLQLGSPAWIAERLGVPVVSDVRSRDVAAGGQGAPLVPVLDAMLLAGRPGPVGALNLGGIANLTVVDDDVVRLAYDVGPANALVDAAVAAAGHGPYDADGALAAAGRVDEAALAALLDEPYYGLAPPKSTGKELFDGRYVRRVLGGAGAGPAGLRTQDLVATLTELTVRTVAAEVRRHALTALVVSGGGVHNPVLMSGLARALDGVDVRRSDVLGAPVDHKEAIAFALIGWLTAHGLPASVPSATGAVGARVLGSITPGRGPLALPGTPTRAPRVLRLAEARSG